MKSATSIRSLYAWRSDKIFLKFAFNLEPSVENDTGSPLTARVQAL
jgi:hypothetical protein